MIYDLKGVLVVILYKVSFLRNEWFKGNMSVLLFCEMVLLKWEGGWRFEVLILVVCCKEYVYDEVDGYDDYVVDCECESYVLNKVVFEVF